MSSCPVRVGFSLVVAAALAACAPGGGSIRPQIFSFNYEVQTLADPEARIAALTAGSPVTDYMSETPCRFRANYASPTNPTATIAGDPGESGFNITVNATTPINTFYTGPGEERPECARVENINITIGAGSEALALGGTTSKSHFNVTIGGVAYSTSLAWFEATLGSFDPGPRYAGGVFRFLAKGPDAAIVIGEGAYAVD